MPPAILKTFILSLLLFELCWTNTTRLKITAINGEKFMEQMVFFKDVVNQGQKVKRGQ